MTDSLADLWSRLDAGPLPGEPTWRGASTGLASPLPVDALAAGSVGAAAVAAAGFLGVAPSRVEVDLARVGSSFRADQLLRVGGERPESFAPLSGFFPTADGWVRTHANYPWHRAALVRALGTEDVAAALRDRAAADVEDAVTAEGGLAVAVRTREEWSRHPQGAAVAGEPLVSVRRTGSPGGRAPAAPRVLDLTRVLAGPVATRLLALLGADVLRLDPPHRPDLDALLVDTGIGKRRAVLDAAGDGADRARLDALVEGADVVVTGYRPGALDRLGLSPEALLARRPDLVVVRLDAWGWTGPWAGRRGFDSIVQAAGGIARSVVADPSARPGTLPAQALDHATGYLAAAAALLGLAERPTRGGSVRDLALARTAEWLCRAPGDGDVAAVDPQVQSLGDAELPPPPLRPPGGGDRWSAPAPPPLPSAAWWSATPR